MIWKRWLIARTVGGRMGGGREEGVALTLETFGPGRDCRVRWGSTFLQPQFQLAAFRINLSFKIGPKTERLKIRMKVSVLLFTQRRSMFVCYSIVCCYRLQHWIERLRVQLKFENNTTRVLSFRLWAPKQWVFRFYEKRREHSGLLGGKSYGCNAN